MFGPKATSIFYNLSTQHFKSYQFIQKEFDQLLIFLKKYTGRYINNARRQEIHSMCPCHS